MRGRLILPNLRLELTGLSGAVTREVEPVVEALPGVGGPEPPDSSAANRSPPLASRRIIRLLGCVEELRSQPDARILAADLGERGAPIAAHHWGLGLLTPAVVHGGQAEAVLAARQAVLTAAHAAHPERFVRQRPRPLALPREVWINAPADGSEPVCCNYGATLISYRSCLKPVDTFRFVARWPHAARLRC